MGLDPSGTSGMASSISRRARGFGKILVLAITAQSIGHAGHAIQEEDQSAETRAETMQFTANAGAAYFGVVIPRVARDEWRIANAALGGSALSDVESVVIMDEYDQIIEKLCTDIENFCAERHLQENLAEVTNLGSACSALALKNCNDCFSRMKTRTWPKADAALSNTWTQLTQHVDRTDERALAAANLAEAELRRRVTLRHTSNSGSWDDLGKGIDFRTLFVRATGELDEHSDFAALSRAICRVEQVTEQPDTAIATTASNVTDIIKAHESESALLVSTLLQGWREDAIRLPAPGQSATDFAQTRRARKIASSRSLAESTRLLILKVSHAIESGLDSGLGVDARGEWEDLAMGSAYPLVIQPETPTLVFRWIRANVQDPTVVDACHALHREYVAARGPLRTEAIDALLTAKCAGGPPIAGSPACVKLDEVTRRRTELACAAVLKMRALLDPAVSSSVQALLKSIQSGWDLSRPWQNF